MGALWHGFANMGAVERDGAFVISRGDGAHVWDSAGTRYLDATAGLWFTNVGHGREEIAAAVADQIRRVAAYSTFGDYAVETTLALADRLGGQPRRSSCSNGTRFSNGSASRRRRASTRDGSGPRTASS